MWVHDHFCQWQWHPRSRRQKIVKGASKIKEDTFSISDCQPLNQGSLPIGNLCILSLSPVVFWREAWSSWGCGMNENWGHIEGSKWPWKEVFCWHNLRMCVRKSLPLYQYLLMNDKKLLCRAYVIQHRLLQLSCKICWISVIWQI